jgi:cytosine/uracil/thiamine/allantoin permease
MSTDPGLRENAPDVEFDLSVIEHSHLFNADLAPVGRSQRKWGMLSFAALWV